MSDTVKAIGRIEWQAIVLLALVFGTGAGLGVAFERTRRPGPQVEQGPFPGGPPPDGQRGGPPHPPEPHTRADSLRVPRYFEQLNLTDSQRLAVRALLESQRPKADSAMAAVLPRLRAITDSTFAAIGALLTPEQRTVYEATKPQRAFLPMPGQGRPMREGGPPGGGFDPRRGGPPPDGGFDPRRRGPPPGGPPPNGRPPDGAPVAGATRADATTLARARID